MKIIVSLFAFISWLSVVTAGVVTWDAVNFTSTFDGGMAYFISVSDTSITQVQITDYLKNVGTTGYDTSVFSQRGDAEKISFQEDTYAVLSVSGGTCGLEANSQNFFVIALSADGKDFAVSELTSPTLTGKDVPWAPLFGENGSSDWTTGKVYSVPEPTAFALLALGVAGLALRRKHA